MADRSVAGKPPRLPCLTERNLEDLDGIIKTLTTMRGELVELVREEFYALADGPLVLL